MDTKTLDNLVECIHRGSESVRTKVFETAGPVILAESSVRKWHPLVLDQKVAGRLA